METILSIYFLSIKHSISISLLVAVKNNPSFVKLNLIPPSTGITFLVDTAFDTLFKFSNNISFLILNFILTLLN